MRDLFGNEIVKNELLRDRFIEPPFSVVSARGGAWRARKKKWLSLGIKSEIGRVAITHPDNVLDSSGKPFSSTAVSVFDPALCELLYNWFCPAGGSVLDPFAGGSVRGIVANYLGLKYTGIDVRKEQIDSNYLQSRDILPAENQPNWIVGDSNSVLDSITNAFNFVLSCPPYGNLEVYSDDPHDISNMLYPDFMASYKSIIQKTCSRLIAGGLACFVVGDFRDKKGDYVGFVRDTVAAFEAAGCKLYNDAILITPVGSAAMRASAIFPKSQKLTKVHQNILVFKKPKA